MHNKVSWDDYRYFFLKVARLGTLTGASQSLKVNHSTVLPRVNALEKKLEARLFERFKSGYVLTESGRDPSLVSVMKSPRRFYHDTWMLPHPDLKNTQRIKAFMGFMYDQVKGVKGIAGRSV
nr:LysR family transcriptional regulator [uncultured Desulfobacter sp.]